MIQESIKNKSYQYSLIISKDFESYVNKTILKENNVSLIFSDEAKVFEIKKEKDVLLDCDPIQAEVL